jgi:hypothetical protein
MWGDIHPTSAGQRTGRSAARLGQLNQALWLVCLSVVFRLASGAVSVSSGLRDHSLGVFAIGLGVLADVAGSTVLIWRFGAERRSSGPSALPEVRAAVVVAAALAVLSVVLAVQSAVALAGGSRPGTSVAALAAASVSVAVLTPLAYAKRRLGQRMASRALQGDGALSAIGAATSLLALAALALNDVLGWWQADRIAALVVAGCGRRRVLAHHATP